ncbi:MULTISPECIES: ankyrin repeat domain-containing protein [Amycolatopsis]|uniref:ankyrin repeat domain-containing protein n=1 Tax=Amycolatopsis TaxID=1813 RepID=UPI00099B5FCB|nr:MULTISPECIES: ankyrin repeat domain-containing protein [Amycolatopsis]MCG3752285.1 ankyrin repeat domain-containing protein [Amycolatopsis sp. Poz14]
MVEYMTPAHIAVEMSDLPALRDLLDQGVDVDEECNGMTLLQHAIDVEGDGHVQTGTPLHVDLTAYLLARGADPLRRSTDFEQVTAEEMARSYGHWLALALFEAWKHRESRSSDL